MAAVGEIAGETVKSSIALAIRSAFAVTSGTPPSTVYPVIYKEKIVQNMKKPCFFIWVMDVKVEKKMNNNYDLTFQMNVRHHPADDDESAYETLMAIGLKLTEVLSAVFMPISVKGIAANKKVKGTQTSYNITDNVLQFYTTYALKAFNPQEEVEKMEQLIINNL